MTTATGQKNRPHALILAAAGALTIGPWTAGVFAQAMPVTPEMTAAADAAPSHNPGVPGTMEALQELITRLDSDLWAEREHAFKDLQAHPLATEEQLTALAKNDRYSLEQRRRLAGVVRERFVESPRGAIGIQFTVPAQSDEPAIIDDVRPNFPAGQLGLLKPGDRIDGVDGIVLRPAPAEGDAPNVAVRRIAGMEDPARRRLISYVVSRDPGDEVVLKIRRPIGPAPVDAAPRMNAQAGDAPALAALEFESLDVKVPLGSYDDLHPLPGTKRAVALQAWSNRAAKLGLSDIEPRLISSRIEPEIWNRARGRQQFAPTVAGDARTAGLFPGRNEQNRSNQFAQVINLGPKNGAVQIVAGQGMVNVIQIAEPNPQKIETKELNDARQMIVARIDSLQQEIDALVQQLGAPSMRAKERQFLEARLQANQQRMAELMKQNQEFLKRQIEQLPR